MIVVGIGPGNLRYASYEAIETITDAEMVVAFKRVGKDLESLREIKYIQRFEELLEIKEDFVFVVSGDPTLYSALEFLKRRGIKIDRVVPSISSFQYLMCKLQKSWNDAKIISLHGRRGDLSDVNKNGITIIFTDDKFTPEYISNKLFEEGFNGKIYAGYNLSYEDELILEKNIGDEFENISDLSIVVVETCL
ncbi:putative cobalt-precorrin-6Y C(5)-methyltransferase [Caloramator mitchellensis]|uniref:Putative cobalt-precorrin-6Y C(5)-methyltransferase n=1 Tax=Caloramator mitchellensis TaxID=908809 RepID=A0A0R3JUK9_CALMK|nr:precorrin-6y C5,15-methyltransferase (decarboxylating) subunit CbiE [Caloramator mitchellensis]KRQ85917.1 putative cobalt-precorrin-6Y C(5)-methyltransferase [Caloramator mitchellensis]